MSKDNTAKNLQFSPEEAAKHFCEYVMGVATYWADPKVQRNNINERIAGLFHSIGATMEGSAVAVPGMRLSPIPSGMELSDFKGNFAGGSFPKSPLGLFPDMNDVSLSFPVRGCLVAIDSNTKRLSDEDSLRLVATEFLSTFSHKNVCLGATYHPDDVKSGFRFHKENNERYYPLMEGPEWDLADPDDEFSKSFFARELYNQFAPALRKATGILKSKKESSILETATNPCTAKNKRKSKI